MRLIDNRFSDVDSGLSYIEEKLKDYKVGLKESTTAIIASESAIIFLLKNAPADNKRYTVSIHKTPINMEVHIEAEGEKIDFNELTALNIDEEYINEENKADFIKSLVGNIANKNIHTSYRRGMNSIHVVVVKSEAKELLITLGALVLGCLFGVLMNLIFGEEVCQKIDYYTLDLFKGMFMKALQLVVGPLVFFSLASCISRFTNLSELGRLGVKTMAMYIFTTLCAIGIGVALYTAFPVGNPQVLNQSVACEADDEELIELSESLELTEFSIRNTISNIVPESIVEPFMHSDLLQIIFLAVCVGVAAGGCGNYTGYLHMGLEIMNQMFLKITGLITRFIPVAIFCAMAELIMFTGTEALLTLIEYASIVVGGMLCMMLFYALLLLVTTGLNPLVFFKKFNKAMLTAFAVSSGSATMPTSMECCRKMGIDNKVASFTIPLGANVNMDGSCMVFITTVLFMSQAYGIKLSGAMLISTVVSIVFLSLGSPSMAGADLVILAVLLRQVGIPIEAIGLIMGIDAIFDMVQAVSNTTGDAVVSLIVAKSERLFDRNKYYS